MPENISRGAAINKIMENIVHQDSHDVNLHNIGLRKAMSAIDTLPAADVVEVRHGRWHRFSKGSAYHNGAIILSEAFQCSVCKESFWNKSNYCPSCGAKMDGGQDDV